MLTLTALTDAEYLISSVALSIDEYYAGVGESPGVWSGKWAEELGLSGVVEAEQLRALVEARDPVSGEELLARNRERSVRAFDMTFSAPKSVSLLWAFAREAVAEVVAATHREAVDEALRFLEERAAVARVQSGGVRRRAATEGWALAAFTHRTSREGDPQLHSHCLVPNLVRRKSDGKYVAFDAGPLFDWCRAAGSVYQAHLQRALSLRLGVVWGPDHHNTREVVGISREQLRAFSKRSVQIEAELEARGALYESPPLRMRAGDEASLSTRPAKDHSLTPSLLAARWHAEAAQVGLPVGAALEHLVCWGEPALGPPRAGELTATLVDPETGLCSRSARFTEADVFEHLCALSGGRLALEEITTIAAGFLSSGQVVRLTPSAEEGRRRPAEWSTAAHRAMEDRVLALMDVLVARDGPATSEAAVESALSAEPGLGEDQVAAVRTLTGEGGALRAVLSPAGFGKTTMLHVAARAAAADGRPVVAAATTAKAVSELAGAGLDARTIARLQLDLREKPLAPGTVVVLDEVSQTPTREAEAVLTAVAACPGGSLWVLGDPRQSQPVGAGGLADEIARLATEGRVVSARLSVNRRQVDLADQEALRLLRAGQVSQSQQLRAEGGWEHEHATPAEARQAMAAALCADIEAHGAEQVAALVVSHADAEDLADRVRSRLAASGVLAGPAMSGPGWTAEREYRAGDRVLLHARSGPSSSRLVNGTTATVTAVDDASLAVRLDGGGAAVLPARFVQGTRKDGSPNVSHAWARTVDGAQGGTWQACHLLGSSALDAYRGYTGQSRSRQPTHTWNTAKVAAVDHGGALADQRGPAEQVAAALAREPDPRLAARSDPWTFDQQLHDLIVEHERVLATRPTDLSEPLQETSSELQTAEVHLSDMEAVAARTAERLANLGRLSALSRRGREERRGLHARLRADNEAVGSARGDVAQLATRAAELRRGQDAYERFEAAEGWRRDESDRLRQRLDQHWAEVVTACVRADDPLAYGIDKLRRARATVACELNKLDAVVPHDRSGDLERLRRQLAGAVITRREAEQDLVESGRQLEQARRRSWGRRGHPGISGAEERAKTGEDRLEQAVAAEAALRADLAFLARDEDERQRALTAARAQGLKLAGELGLLDSALEHTRAGRVLGLAGQSAPHVVDLLGPLPSSPGGRAVWCHHALGIEATLDRERSAQALRGKADRWKQARQQIWAADRVLQRGPEEPGPGGWATMAGDASRVLEGLRTLALTRPPLQTSGWATRSTSVGEQAGAGQAVDL